MYALKDFGMANIKKEQSLNDVPDSDAACRYLTLKLRQGLL